MAKKVVALDVDIKTTTVGEAVKKTQSLKSELRQLQNQLASGELQGKAFEDASRRAGDLRDRIGDVNARVNVLASDTKKLDTFISVGQGIAGGFAAAQGAMAVFGAESEDLQKQLVKIQGAMALLNGVQAVAATLNKDSAASVLLLGKAQAIVTTATRGLTVAFGGMAKAIIATGIGALVVAVGLLIANFDKLKDVMTTAASKARDFAKESKEISDLSVKNAEDFDEEARSLRRLGFEEDMIEQKRKERRLQALKDLENTQKANKKSVKESEESLEKVKAWEKWGFGLIPRLLFGDEKDVAKAKESVSETSKQIEKLQNDIFETEEKRKEEQKKRDDLAKKEDEKKRKEAADKRIAATKTDQERLIATMSEGYAKELAMLEMKHKEEQRLAKLNGENLAILKRRQSQELFDLDVKYTESVKKNESLNIQDRTKQLDEFFAAQERRKQARQQLEQDFVNSSIDLLGQLGAAAKDQSNLQKGLVLAQIAADTASAISSLVKNSEGNIYNPLTGGLAGAVQFTTGLARIFAGVAQAKRVLQGGGGAGGGGGQQPQLTRSQPPQSFGLDTRALNQQGDTRVYVVENDITRSQRRVAQLRESAIID
jgi:hypothetical protein